MILEVTEEEKQVILDSLQGYSCSLGRTIEQIERSGYGREYEEEASKSYRDEIKACVSLRKKLNGGT